VRGGAGGENPPLRKQKDNLNDKSNSQLKSQQALIRMRRMRENEKEMLRRSQSQSQSQCIEEGEGEGEATVGVGGPGGENPPLRDKENNISQETPSQRSLSQTKTAQYERMRYSKQRELEKPQAEIRKEIQKALKEANRLERERDKETKRIERNVKNQQKEMERQAKKAKEQIMVNKIIPPHGGIQHVIKRHKKNLKIILPLFQIKRQHPWSRTFVPAWTKIVRSLDVLHVG